MNDSALAARAESAYPLSGSHDYEQHIRRNAFIAGALSERTQPRNPDWLTEREREIAARVVAAKAENWVVESVENFGFFVGEVDRYETGEYAIAEVPHLKHAVLIANAPTDLTFLLAEVSRLRYALQEAQSE